MSGIKLLIGNLKEMRRYSADTPTGPHKQVIEKRSSLPNVVNLCAPAPGNKHFLTFFQAENSFDEISHHWTILVPNEITVAGILDMLNNRLDDPRAVSIFIPFKDSWRRLDLEEKIYSCLQVEFQVNFVIKNNKELVRFFLENDSKTFWTFRLTQDTTVAEVRTKMSAKLNLIFTIHLKSSGRQLEDHEKPLFLFYGSKLGEEEFVVKKAPKPVVRKTNIDETVSALLVQLGINENPDEVLRLLVEPKWCININELEIEEEWIGEGSFAVVWGGTYQGQPVAIKQIKVDEKMVKYIQREIDALVMLAGCPNIVQLVGVVQRKEMVFIVTERVTQGDLWELIRDTTLNMSWSLRIKLAMDIANAIKHYTAKNLIHRDLKSDNLLVQADMSLKLCDFGMSKPMTNNKGTICGTQKYIAPEVILGEDYNWKADIFSFGVLLFELILRKDVPKRGPKTEYLFTEEHFQGSMPEDCPKELMLLTVQCLNAKPQDRPDPETILKALQMIQANI